MLKTNTRPGASCRYNSKNRKLLDSSSCLTSLLRSNP
uniref:Uncharacterized protein n=1 Tax=Arundo donax TaxID=35708 RepID=A0A0A8ZWF3_ARUDO